MADRREYEEGTIYEAGVGIYFSDGEDHTNINVEDELLDHIDSNTERIENIENNYVRSVSVDKVTVNSVKTVGTPTQLNYNSSNETLEVELGVSPTVEAVEVIKEVHTNQNSN